MRAGGAALRALSCPACRNNGCSAEFLQLLVEVVSRLRRAAQEEAGQPPDTRPLAGLQLVLVGAQWQRLCGSVVWVRRGGKEGPFAVCLPARLLLRRHTGGRLP